MQKENLIKNKKSAKESFASFLCDYVPLIIFIVIYKFSKAPDPLLPATLCLLVSSFTALIFAYFLTGKIAKMPLISAIILGIFGGLTLILKDDIFIKLKPTIINLIFAAVLFYGYFFKKPLIGHLFAGNLKMSKESWLILGYRWAWFFVFLAILNEIIWRNFSTDFWVSFKVFGMFPLSMIFTISQIPFIFKNMEK